MVIYNLQPVPIDADGNCFFGALSHQMYGTEKYHLQVRQQAIDVMRNNIGDYMNFMEDDEDIIKYIDRQQKEATWATDAIIQATVRALRVDLFIILLQEDHVTTDIEPQSGYPNLNTNFNFVSRACHRYSLRFESGYMPFKSFDIWRCIVWQTRKDITKYAFHSPGC